MKTYLNTDYTSKNYLVPTMQNLAYWKMRFTLNQYARIRFGIKHNLDISWYCDPQFTASQMQQIIFGLVKHKDVSKYAKPELNVLEMEKISKLL